MCLNLQVMKALNDNEPSTFQPIGVQAEKLVSRLVRNEEHDEDRQRQTGGDRTKEEHAGRDGDDVERDLDEIWSRAQWRNWLELVLNKRTSSKARQGGRG